LKILATFLYIISSEILDELFINFKNFDDGLSDKLLNKIDLKAKLKEEWIIKSKEMYKNWLENLISLTFSH